MHTYVDDYRGHFNVHIKLDNAYILQKIKKMYRHISASHCISND